MPAIPANIPALPPQRASLIARLDEVEDQIREGGRAKPRISAEDSAILNRRRKDLLSKYYELLPIITFSRCPYCEAPLQGPFDPWGLDGPWWQEKRAVSDSLPQGCAHFGVLTGAVALGPNGVNAGTREAFIGPDAPFVIPKVLELPTMLAVISEIGVVGGHRAFPIAYFSSQPHRGGLANPWTRNTCTFTLRDGSTSFAIKSDPYDFDLQPWLYAGKIRWIKPHDPDAVLSKEPPAKFPYSFPAQPRLRQSVVRDKVFTAPLPNNEVYEPFGD